MSDSRRDTTLRGLLLGSLLGPLLGLLVVATGVSFYGARLAATHAFDRVLMDPVQALSQRVVVQNGKLVLQMSPETLHTLFTHVYDVAWFQIQDARHQQIAGNMNLPVPERLSGKPRFYDAVIRGANVRVGVVRVRLDSDPLVGNAAPEVIIQVAETLIRRDRNLYELMALMITPALLVVLTAIAMVSFGIGHGLKPLDALKQEIAARSWRDLHPVNEMSAPLEIRPVIVALNQLLADLAHVLDSQQRFLANAAHQLRTPLAGLQTQVELLLRDSRSDETRDALNVVLDTTRRVTHLANQLLALARAEPGGSHLLNMQYINLADLVEVNMAMWLARARVRNIDLGFELEPVMVEGDMLQLGELLGNLVDNALRYTQEGGMITVRSRYDGVGVLEVEDNGPGIPEAQREKVLERFYRIEGSPGNGCGLGLSIVAEIARGHHARLQILTPASGRGLLVRVLFAGASGLPRA